MPIRIGCLLATSIWRGRPGGWSVGNFDYFRQRLTSVEQFAASTSISFNLADDGDPERIVGRRVTWNYFTLFGIPPAHGRTFNPDEDQPGRTHVVLLSDSLWRRRYGANPSIVGRQIRMSGEMYDVVGVMPPEIDQIDDTAQAWIPIGFTPAQLALYDEFYLDAYARQRQDVSLSQVNDEFARIAQALSADHPDLNRERTAGVEPLSTVLVGDYRLRLLILLAAVGLVLLIACGNVANLLLARLAARSRELAIRAAIGAGRGRIVRQVLSESLVLAMFGGSRWARDRVVVVAAADQTCARRRAASRVSDAERSRAGRRDRARRRQCAIRRAVARVAGHAAFDPDRRPG